MCHMDKQTLLAAARLIDQITDHAAADDAALRHAYTMGYIDGQQAAKRQRKDKDEADWHRRARIAAQTRINPNSPTWQQLQERRSQ